MQATVPVSTRPSDNRDQVIHHACALIQTQAPGHQVATTLNGVISPWSQAECCTVFKALAVSSMEDPDRSPFPARWGKCAAKEERDESIRSTAFSVTLFFRQVSASDVLGATGPLCQRFHPWNFVSSSSSSGDRAFAFVQRVCTDLPCIVACMGSATLADAVIEAMRATDRNSTSTSSPVSKQKKGRSVTNPVRMLHWACLAGNAPVVQLLMARQEDDLREEPPVVTLAARTCEDWSAGRRGDPMALTTAATTATAAADASTSTTRSFRGGSASPFDLAAVSNNPGLVKFLVLAAMAAFTRDSTFTEGHFSADPWRGGVHTVHHPTALMLAALGQRRPRVLPRDLQVAGENMLRMLSPITARSSTGQSKNLAASQAAAGLLLSPLAQLSSMQNSTALHLACQIDTSTGDESSAILIQFILDACPSRLLLEVLLTPTSPSGMTPLMILASQRSTIEASLLIILNWCRDHIARVLPVVLSATSENSFTAADWAAEAGHHEIARTLKSLERGGDRDVHMNEREREREREVGDGVVTRSQSCQGT